jgi:acyl-CoA thioester hydrolase
MPSRPHALELSAAADDIDELGHVNNLVYVRWVLEAATDHSRARGWDFDAYRAAGGVFVVRRQEIDYLRPVFAGDPIRVVTWVESMGRVSSLRRTEITSRDEPIARAATTWAFVSVATGRPTRIPEALRAAFAAGE